MTEDTPEDAPEDTPDGDEPEKIPDGDGPERIPDAEGSETFDPPSEGATDGENSTEAGETVASDDDADDPVEFDASTGSESIGHLDSPDGEPDADEDGSAETAPGDGGDGGPPGDGGDGPPGDGEDPDDEDDLGPGRPGDRARELRQEIHDLEQRLEEFESDVESRTVGRSQVERDLRRYVRRRMRRGHAHGWGPYLVLLYGTIMTLGAFHYLQGGWAIGAMIVIWLSTLGLYVQLAIFGAIISALKIPVGVYHRVDDWRS